MYTKTDEVDEQGQPILQKTITTETVVKISYTVLRNTVNALQAEFDDLSAKLDVAKADLAEADEVLDD